MSFPSAAVESVLSREGVGVSYEAVPEVSRAGAQDSPFACELQLTLSYVQHLSRRIPMLSLQI